jgi:cytochrome o ubiquinol oxidase subunit 2
MVAKRRWAVMLVHGATICAVLLTLSACAGNLHMSFLNPQGPVAHAEMVHFYLVLGIMAVFVAGPIFLVLPFILWRYRYGNPKAVGYTPKWRDSVPMNVLTWAGPILIVCVLGFFVWRDSHKLDPYKPIASSQPALQVQVIGYDWKWLFIYPKQHIATIGILVMPAGRSVSFHLTSATVMKSFFIPALGSQIYAMGGMVTRLHLEASKTGRFLGENTMYDGNGFHDEKFVAVAKSPAEFKAWVGKIQATGVPLNAGMLKLLSASSTRGKLIAQLPHAASRNGYVSLTGVTAELFPRVVKAMRDDTEPEQPAAGTKASQVSLTAQKPQTIGTKEQP